MNIRVFFLALVVCIQPGLMLSMLDAGEKYYGLYVNTITDAKLKLKPEVRLGKTVTYSLRGQQTKVRIELVYNEGIFCTIVNDETTKKEDAETPLRKKLKELLSSCPPNSGYSIGLDADNKARNTQSFWLGGLIVNRYSTKHTVDKTVFDDACEVRKLVDEEFPDEAEKLTKQDN